mgnify:CR=1 FL=1
MTRDLQEQTRGQPVSQTRFWIGGIIFVAGFLSPLLLPLVSSSDLPGKWKAILSTGLVAGLPEVGMLLAVAVLGKQGFAELKRLFFSKFREYTEPAAVSLTRYRIGLFMFFAPLLVGWMQPYISHFLPVFESDRILPFILGDLVFASSFIVLGAGFWDKIRSLFVHDAGYASISGHSTDNDDFIDNVVLKQKPVYTGQVHAIYNFKTGYWASVSTGYGNGGEISLDRETTAFKVDNWLWAATFGFPIGKSQSVNLTWLSGQTQNHVGRDSDNLLLGWSIRWMD